MYSERIMVHFPRGLVNEPVLSMVVKQFDITFNIISARITENEEGQLKVELQGKRPNVLQAVEFMKERGVGVRSLSKIVTIDRKLCTDCGACVVHCPTAALYYADDRSVAFDPKKCITCELCRLACPYRAVLVAHAEEGEKV
jgi:L-aspartate semialdehyde sulfurtransferase ferredoxin